MRILFVTPYYLPDLRFGGPPQKIHSIARGLAARGHQVNVATFDHTNRAATEETEVEGIRVCYIPWMGRGLRQVPTNIATIRNEVAQAQIVHGYGLYNFVCPAAAFVSNRAGVPFVLEPLGMYPARARSQVAKRAYNLVITKWLMRSTAAVVAASANEVKELGAIIDKQKIVLRRNGIDVAAFAELPNGDSLRDRWNIRSDEKVVLFIGRLSPIKNLEELILAFDKSELPNARLILVGPPEPAYEARLHAMIHARRLESRVLLAGPLYGQDQRAALGLADLFVLPSSFESFGNAAAEAVAAGVPVVVTETSGIAPLIHGRAGLAVPLGADNLASGIRTMLDREKRQPFIAKMEEVKRDLSWDEPIAQTERLYENIIRNTKLGRGE